MWQTDEMIYMIWHQDSTEFHIVGNLNKDEILKDCRKYLKINKKDVPFFLLRRYIR